jgi:hypothetical protein
MTSITLIHFQHNLPEKQNYVLKVFLSRFHCQKQNLGRLMRSRKHVDGTLKQTLQNGTGREITCRSFIELLHFFCESYKNQRNNYDYSESSSGVANPRPKLESRISDFPIFWVYFFCFLSYCGPKNQYFLQIF